MKGYFLNLWLSGKRQHTVAINEGQNQHETFKLLPCNKNNVKMNLQESWKIMFLHSYIPFLFDVYLIYCYIKFLTLVIFSKAVHYRSYYIILFQRRCFIHIYDACNEKDTTKCFAHGTSYWWIRCSLWIRICNGQYIKL